jgi:hypothetical protein
MKHCPTSTFDFVLVPYYGFYFSPHPATFYVENLNLYNVSCSTAWIRRDQFDVLVISRLERFNVCVTSITVIDTNNRYRRRLDQFHKPRNSTAQPRANRVSFANTAGSSKLSGTAFPTRYKELRSNSVNDTALVTLIIEAILTTALSNNFSIFQQSIEYPPKFIAAFPFADTQMADQIGPRSWSYLVKGRKYVGSL